MADDTEAIGGADNIISLEQFRAARTKGNDALDDDELMRRAGEKITKWKAAGTPTLTEVQQLFYELIYAGASAMARDKIIDAIIAAFGTELGGKRALVGTWGKLAKDFAAECAQDARNNTTQPELNAGRKGRVAGSTLAYRARACSGTGPD